MSEAADILQRARDAAYGAFPFRDAYVDEDLYPSADAALRSVLSVLVNPPWGSAEVYTAEMLEVLRTTGRER